MFDNGFHYKEILDLHLENLGNLWKRTCLIDDAMLTSSEKENLSIDVFDLSRDEIKILFESFAKYCHFILDLVATWPNTALFQPQIDIVKKKCDRAECYLLSGFAKYKELTPEEEKNFKEVEELVKKIFQDEPKKRNDSP